MKRAMNRRKMLRWLAVGLPAIGALPRWSAAEAARQLRLGVDMNSYGIRWSSATPPAARFKNILEMLDHCQQLGAGGIQARIDAWDNDFAEEVRAKLESSQMYLEGQVGLPREQSEVARFESLVRSAKAAGALILRTVSLGGRRYEAIDTANGWREFLERGAGQRSAAPGGRAGSQRDASSAQLFGLALLVQIARLTSSHPRRHLDAQLDQVRELREARGLLAPRGA